MSMYELGSGLRVDGRKPELGERTRARIVREVRTLEKFHLGRPITGMMRRLVDHIAVIEHYYRFLQDDLRASREYGRREAAEANRLRRRIDHLSEHFPDHSFWNEVNQCANPEHGELIGSGG